MKPQNLKTGQKIFKIKILDFEIQCTNFLQFNREDFLSLFAGILFAIFMYYMILHIPLALILLYFFPKLIYAYMIYCIWIVLDRKTASTCGRRCRQKWFRKNPIFVGLKNYFSSKLIKTSDLRPGRNYLLAAYPHAVTPLSTTIHFLSDVNNIAEIFPKIDFCCVSHDLIFSMPLVKEIFLAVGLFSCKESSLKHLLTSAPSKGVIIYPGGESEQCHAVPGSTYRILMSNRKGFIRVALMTGASLVPIFNFGEINIFEFVMIPNPIKHVFKRISKRISTQISMNDDLVVPKGRGIFQNHFGFIPKQHPVTSVVGSPIHVPKIENPSMEIIDKYHKKYFDALSELFEEHKHTCDVAGADAKLIML